MNNSKIAIDNVPLEIEQRSDNSEALRQRETKVLRILEALKNISASKYWDTITNEILSPELQKSRDKLESEKEPVEMYRLQGQIEWAKKTDLSKSAQGYLNELASIRTQLKPQDNDQDY